ncbi:hypothetical protein [Methyloceanibacter sp.]|uniref:hypothetical protein n=1 Tax=Methyloceanibacter sp. TaxID=1965321 RepID=UPI003D6D7B83
MKGGPEIPATSQLSESPQGEYSLRESRPPELPVKLSEASPTTNDLPGAAETPRSIFSYWAEQNPRSESLDKDYLIKHWRGELSLPVSFWLNAWLLQAFFVVAMRVLAGLMPPAVMLGLVILAMAIAVWGWVGVWRSATRVMKQEKRYFWPIVACSVVVLVALSWVFSFIA